ncbi:MAG: hypothetical protein RIS92_1433 [Verrucomicrobiota bacterium]
MHGLKFHHFVTHGLDDFPTAGSSSSGHDDGARHFNPDGHDVVRIGADFKEGEEPRSALEGSSLSRGGESERDDSHGFLGVITPVAPSHVGGAEDLSFAEDRADGPRTDFSENEIEQAHHEEPDEES